jgi:inositol transport system permease protein
MSNMKLTAAPASEGSSFFANLRHKMPKDTGIFVVMLVIALTFEIAGWYVRDQSFLLNTNRLVLIVLQVAIIGIIAVGVTQVIITTGIDLSSGSVIALAAVVAASLAQTSDSLSPMFPALVNLPAVIPICAGIGVGLLCGLNGVLANGIGVGGLPGILSIQPTYWQVYAMAMAIAVVVPIILTTVVYQRKYRQGTLQIV